MLSTVVIVKLLDFNNSNNIEEISTFSKAKISSSKLSFISFKTVHNLSLK